MHEERDTKRGELTYRCRRFTLAPIGRVMLDCWVEYRDDRLPRGQPLRRDPDGSWWTGCDEETARKILGEVFPDAEAGRYVERHWGFWVAQEQLDLG